MNGHNNMINIGTKEQIYSGTFMVADGEEAIIGIPIEGTTLKLTFTFLPGESGQQLTASWVGEGGSIRFTLTGWRYATANCFPDPIKVGEVGKRKLYLQMAQYLIGAQNNLVHIFVYLGAPNE